MKRVHEWPYIDAIERCIQTTSRQMYSERCKLNLWRRRRDSLQDLWTGLKFAARTGTEFTAMARRPSTLLNQQEDGNVSLASSSLAAVVTALGRL